MTASSGIEMIEGKGRLVNRPGVAKGKTYPKYFVYIPTEVYRDGLFPFKEGELLKIKIDARNKRLLIEKVEKTEESLRENEHNPP